MSGKSCGGDNGTDFPLATLDDLVLVFFPDQKWIIRQVQYFVALNAHLEYLRKISKVNKHGNDTGAGDDAGDVIDDITEYPDKEVITALTKLNLKKRDNRFYTNPKRWFPSCLPHNDFKMLDEIHKQRSERLAFRDNLAQNMSPEEYLTFTQCYSKSFVSKWKKFQKWLKNECGLDEQHIQLPKVVVNAVAHLGQDRLEKIIKIGIELSLAKKRKDPLEVPVKLTPLVLTKAIEQLYAEELQNKEK